MKVLKVIPGVLSLSSFPSSTPIPHPPSPIPHPSSPSPSPIPHAQSYLLPRLLDDSRSSSPSVAMSSPSSSMMGVVVSLIGGRGAQRSDDGVLIPFPFPVLLSLPVKFSEGQGTSGPHGRGGSPHAALPQGQSVHTPSHTHMFPPPREAVAAGLGSASELILHLGGAAKGWGPSERTLPPPLPAACPEASPTSPTASSPTASNPLSPSPPSCSPWRSPPSSSSHMKVCIKPLPLT